MLREADGQDAESNPAIASPAIPRIRSNDVGTHLNFGQAMPYIALSKVN